MLRFNREHEAGFGLGVEPGEGEPRAHGQTAAEWRAQISRIAAQLVDAAELGRIVRVK